MTKKQLEKYLRQRGYRIVRDKPESPMWCLRPLATTWGYVERYLDDASSPSPTLWERGMERNKECVYFVNDPPARFAYRYCVEQMHARGWKLATLQDLQCLAGTGVEAFTVDDSLDSSWFPPIGQRLVGSELEHIPGDEAFSSRLWFVRSDLSERFKKSIHSKPLPLP